MFKHQMLPLNATTKRNLKTLPLNATTKRYLKTLPPNAISNGSDASRVGKINKNSQLLSVSFCLKSRRGTRRPH